MDDFAEKLNDLLVDTFRSILKVEEQMVNNMGSLNLSISEVHLLESVEKCGEAGGTVSELAKDLGITLSSVTVAVGS